MAEPPEGLNTSDIEKETEVPLVNGNHVDDDKPETIQKEASSPDVIIFDYLIIEYDLI